MRPISSPWLSLKALAHREFYSRVGPRGSGALWAIANPLAQLAILGFLLSHAQRALGSGLDFLGFILLGILNYNLFKSIQDRVMGSLSSNKALFTYKPVKPVLVIGARAFIELLMQLTVWLLFIGWAYSSNRGIHVSSFFDLVIAFLLTAWMGLGVGVFASSSVVLHARAKEVISLISKPLYFVSAIFYSVKSMPEYISDLLLLNPLVHSVDFIRASLLENYQYQDSSLLFPFLVGLLFLFTGLYLLEKFELVILERS